MVMEDGKRIPVAEGRAHPHSEEGGHIIHNEPPPYDCFKVNVDVVLPNCGEYKVPHPAEEDLELIERCTGYVLKWPKALVEFPDQVMQ